MPQMSLTWESQCVTNKNQTQLLGDSRVSTYKKVWRPGSHTIPSVGQGGVLKRTEVWSMRSFTRQLSCQTVILFLCIRSSLWMVILNSISHAWSCSPMSHQSLNHLISPWWMTLTCSQTHFYYIVPHGLQASQKSYGLKKIAHTKSSLIPKKK